MAQSQYDEIIFQINNLLKQEKIYPLYMGSIAEGKNDYKISQVYTKKNYDDSWITTLEECIVPLDTIVRNPRKFIIIEEDIVDVSLARSISIESVKHLAQHTNLIAAVKKDGSIIPSKILNTSKEESFEIYENRFIYTLLLKVNEFVERRTGIVKKALMQAGALGVDIKSNFKINDFSVDFTMSNSANFPFEAAFKKQGDEHSDLERIAYITRIYQDFLSSPFAKELKNCALVRPPITRTNVILKDPNFKKALTLWQFVESAEKMDFRIDTVTEATDLNATLTEKYRGIVFLNTVLLQSIAETRQENESLEKTLKQDQVLADDYVTKNIDDFVPDDFPQLKMDLNEVRRIYYRVPGQKTLSLTEIAKVNAALDRVYRQYRINKARDDSITKKRLIAKQLEEEAQAKRLALREARDIERAKKQEEARRRLEQRKLEAERRAALERAEQERLEAERRAEEERILLEAEKVRLEQERKRQEEEKRIEIEKQAAEEAHKLKIIEEQKMAARIQQEMEEYKARLESEEKRIELELIERQENYWKKQKELQLRLQVEDDKTKIFEKETFYFSKVKKDEKNKMTKLEMLRNTLRNAMIVEHYQEIESILESAKEHYSEEQLKEIRAEIKATEKAEEKKRKKKENKGRKNGLQKLTGLFSKKDKDIIENK
ncbi:MAG: hypothetical protein BWX72_00676 [Firmicutes bacterium ADurb.Bin080]|jgi:hypothetical protein|nr:hypothetical protein [Clostridiales bacterium]OQC16314.1 MAG: hypothetical protein BWX72_00676 [Firmicutes bacterium ADurb.Bin080]